VVLHAVCDALLGAAGLGDIGQHFSDKDARWKDADSTQFVRAVMDMLSTRGLKVTNADVTVLAEEPKLAPHRDAMQESLTRLLGTTAVNVKATTTEGLGFTGRREGIAAQAVVLLSKT
jgi:2-C-methyl-D-erythritol 2,4-cyclodiphosphate synthase